MNVSRLIAVFVCAVALACGGEPTTEDVASDSTASDISSTTTTGGEEAGLGIQNEHHLASGLITSGMPDRAGLEAARDHGITTVISLRTMEEPGAADEAAMVEELGMTFVSVPVDGSDGITEANARAVDAAIGDQEAHALLHCGSSNRAGAMVALRAFFVGGESKAAALSLGREAGLTRLLDAVVSAIDTHCATNPDPARC